MKISFIPLPDIEEAVFTPGEGGIFRARAGESWGFIDSRGNVVVPFAFAEVANGFCDGRAAVNEQSYKKTWGYVDRKAELVVPHELAAAHDFAEGRAVITRDIDGHWMSGVIDTDGREVLPCRYHGISPFSGGLAGVRDENHRITFVRLDGSRAFAFHSSANIGLGAFAFVNGFAAVCDDHYRWGFINSEGETVGGMRYDKAWAFSEGRGAVAHRVGVTGDDDHERSLYSVGYVDAQGAEVIAPRFGAAYPFREGFARVDLEHPAEGGRRRIGFIDPGGEIVVSCEYEKARDFSEGLVAVRSGDKWGYVNARGEVVIDFRFDYAGSFSQGIAEVGIYGAGVGSYGYIDQQGGEILPREYTTTWTVHHGVALVEQGGRMRSDLQQVPGARFYLVVFGGGEEFDADAAASLVRDAMTRCLEVASDMDAHTAWSALDGALTKLATPEERHAALFDLAADVEHPILLEYMAAELAGQGEHELVVKLTTRALKKRPGRQSLLLGLQAAHLHLGHEARAAAVGRELAAAAKKLPENEGESVQAKIDTMHRLVNDAYALFTGGSSVAELVETLQGAAELEQELLAYWLAHSLTGRELPEGRGELTASGMYIAALRQAGEFTRAADWFRQITEDRHLLDQCLRDFRKSGEDTLNNGIGALIDTREQEDLDYGGDILDFLDAKPPFVSAMLPLACSCLAVQRGEIERALAYLEVAVRLGKGTKVISDGGSDICAMAWADEDMVPLHQLPEFVNIVGRKR